MIRTTFQSDLRRAVREAEKRDPVDNALLAFYALSDADRKLMVDRFNAMESGRARPDRLSYTPNKERSK